MGDDTTFAATVFVLLGVLNLVFPYTMAQLKERLDAIGSTRSWSDVEPAGWYVVLTRLLGVALIGIGLAYLLGVG